MTDLEQVLGAMEPSLRDGEFVFVPIPADALPPEHVEALLNEPEGVTVVLRRQAAEALGFEYDFVARWITLKVHSALGSVGLTAAVSTELALDGISANILAGYYHDHILVPTAAADQAMAALAALSARARKA